MPSKSPVVKPKCLVVYGDRRGPARLGNLVSQWFEPRGTIKTKLVHPTRDQVLKELESSDIFWFWGHGNNGKLHLGSGESLHPDQIPDSIQLKTAELRACYSLESPDLTTAWHRVTESVSGFRGVTMEWWGRVNPMRTFPR